MAITIYGTKDLKKIEIEGDINRAFRCESHASGDFLAFSDGTVLRMRTDVEYRWVIDVEARGTGNRETWTHTEEGDQARVHGATWVVHGTGWATVRA